MLLYRFSFEKAPTLTFLSDFIEFLGGYVIELAEVNAGSVGWIEAPSLNHGQLKFPSPSFLVLPLLLSL